MRFDVVGLTCRMKSVLITAMFNIGTAGAIIYMPFRQWTEWKTKFFNGKLKSSSRFQASDDQRKLLLNIKWQVLGEDGKWRSLLGRKCAKHLNQTYKTYKAKESSILDL